MNRIAAIGEETRVRGYALVGVLVLPAEEPEQVRTVWRRLPADIAVVLVTKMAATALDEPDRAGAWPLVTVMS